VNSWRRTQYVNTGGAGEIVGIGLTRVYAASIKSYNRESLNSRDGIQKKKSTTLPNPTLGATERRPLAVCYVICINVSTTGLERISQIGDKRCWFCRQTNETYSKKINGCPDSRPVYLPADTHILLSRSET